MASGGPAPRTDRELACSRLEVLGSWPDDRDLWVFAYGSLMWNPAIRIAETAPAVLEGWQRSFCLDLPGGRGTPARPGLMCALVASGRCEGFVHRIAASDVESETGILWLREMAFGSYVATFAPVTVKGLATDALLFVANPARIVRYDLAEQARRIAAAEGPIGSNREYLFSLEKALAAAGLSDPYVSNLARQVRSLIDASTAR